MLLHIMDLTDTLYALHNRYYGKTQIARTAHPEQRSLVEEQERSVEERVEKRDAPGYPPKHNELWRMIVRILNNPEGTHCDGVEDHCTSRFLKRHPRLLLLLHRLWTEIGYWLLMRSA